ncbi:energy-coupling factor transporter transmembrane component T [uncultured Thermanaerothrix sp.]|uniref:energy-coupling factor transporter transmembrane component T family protein n=1 Tax=uncultured Thermanaerothrix sp. TaxID=1195149 RepID=UPI002610B626|nr:energy-coupling factor transporter transmembrane component T [uncultured Thermanaerothrix sp.]
MSESFEYLRLISLGQYLPLSSCIHRREARAKVAALISIILAVVFSSRLSGLLLALGAALIVLRLAHIGWGYALRGLLPPLPFIILLMGIQMVWVSYREAGAWEMQWGWLRLSQGGVIAGALLGARFAVLLLWLMLGSYCISNTEMVRALRQLLRPLRYVGISSRDVAMGVQVALRFVPYLALLLERIAKAQASRGAVWGTPAGGLVTRVRQLLPILIPLFLLALRKAETLALAMEARGYSNPIAEDSLQLPPWVSADRWLLVIALGLAGAILFL